jgi:hypothetical protein
MSKTWKILASGSAHRCCVKVTALRAGRYCQVMAWSMTDARRGLLARRIRLLVAATISYNVIEAAVALSEGARVSSTALIGFGLDSVIEVSSAGSGCMAVRRARP